MLDDGEEGGVRLWHLVKASEESELPKHRRGSVRERGGERAKAIPEIYLTRLLSMKVTERRRRKRMLPYSDDDTRSHLKKLRRSAQNSKLKKLFIRNSLTPP